MMGFLEKTVPSSAFPSLKLNGLLWQRMTRLKGIVFYTENAEFVVTLHNTKLERKKQKENGVKTEFIS